MPPHETAARTERSAQCRGSTLLTHAAVYCVRQCQVIAHDSGKACLHHCTTNAGFTSANACHTHTHIVVLLVWGTIRTGAVRGMLPSGDTLWRVHVSRVHMHMHSSQHSTTYIVAFGHCHRSRTSLGGMPDHFVVALCQWGGLLPGAVAAFISACYVWLVGSPKALVLRQNACKLLSAGHARVHGQGGGVSAGWADVLFRQVRKFCQVRDVVNGMSLDRCCVGTLLEAAAVNTPVRLVMPHTLKLPK